MSDASELDHRLGTVARRELAVHGITRYDQVAARGRADLLAIHGVGLKAIRILEEELEARGQSFSD